MVANKFNTLNTNDKDAVPPKLDEWELNDQYPMWEVQNVLKLYGDGNPLDVLQYAKS